VVALVVGMVNFAVEQLHHDDHARSLRLFYQGCQPPGTIVEPFCIAATVAVAAKTYYLGNTRCCCLGYELSVLFLQPAMISRIIKPFRQAHKSVIAHSSR